MAIIIILLLIIVFILGYEQWETFLAWLGRIKIGQLSEAEWLEKTKEVLRKWLKKGAPEVTVNDSRNTNFIKKINDYGKLTSVTYWQDASLLKAANCFGEEMSEEVKSLISRYIHPDDGEWKVVPKRMDSAMLCFEMLSGKFTDSERFRPAMDSVAEKLKNAADNHGTIPYNESIPEYRFVDTVGMICPFMIKYALTYSCDEYISLAMKQIREYREHGINEEIKIPFHSFKEESFEPLGVCGWGRGCAWWAIGLVDSLRTLLDSDGHNREKAELLKLSIEFLDALKKYIHEDGTVDRIVLCFSVQDSSACAMLAYCYAYMAELLDNDEYKKLAKKMTEKIRTVTRRNGVIDFAQGDTHGIGFYSEKLCVVPAAQGFAIAANEILQRK